MPKINIAFLFFILLASVATAQSFDADLFSSMSVRSVGPAGMSGRVTAIDVHPSNKDHIYIGSASGGVWESKNGGVSWKPIFDKTGVLSIGCIKINPSNPAEIWVGTGEGNPRNSHNSGAGVFFSNDAGRTWTFKGLKETRLIHRILIDTNEDDVVYVGAMGSAWGNSPDRGVYKTTNKGQTWEKSLYVNDGTGIADMVADPQNSNKILAAMWEFGRKPWTFNSGGPGSGLHLTYDGGKTWKKLTVKDGLPKGDLGRIGIAFAQNKPNIVYALIEAKKNGLYKSTDGGESWTLVSTKNIGNRPFYYAELYVDPSNENRIYNLYTYLSKSEDGGKTFKTIADYGNQVHPDHHALWIDPQNSNYIINGNDGGLYITRDGGKSWDFIDNLPLGQFYHVSVDDEFPYNIYGGMQDNGSWVGPNTIFQRGGISNYHWQELYFGDGFDVLPNPKDSRFGYAMSQGGNVAKYDRKTGRTSIVKPVHPEGKALRFNWNAPIAADPFNKDAIYFGSQYVHYSEDEGNSWKIISPDLTTNDTSKQKQDLSGGLTIDATNAENYTTLLAIAPSTLEENVIWAASDDGRIHITKDGGDNWVDVSRNVRGMPKGAWIAQIELSQSDAGTAYIAVNDYRRNNWSAYAFVTKDYGKSWRRIANDRQIGSFVCSIVQDKAEKNLLFLGADDGLYVSLDAGTNWQKWGDKMPPVQIRDMKIHPKEDALVLGTFGRSFYVIDDLSTLRALVKQPKMLQDSFRLISAPTAYKMSYKSYQGSRFYAQGEFRGQSKSTSAKINYYIKDAGKKDKLKFYVINELGDTIRTQSRKVKSGFNAFYWYKDHKGVHWPSRKLMSAKDKTKEPSGPSALAGQYKIVAIYKGIKDSVELELKDDPRLSIDKSKEKSRMLAYTNFEQSVDKAAKLMQRLLLAESSIQTIDKISYAYPDSVGKEIRTMQKELKDSIKTLKGLYFMPRNLKGIQRNPNTIQSKLGSTSWYAASRWDEMDENTLNLMRTTNKSIDQASSRIQAFCNEDFEKYRKYISSHSPNLFRKWDKEKQ